MLKSILKKLIVFILTLEARLVLWKYKPKIIAVVGSVGKTSTKDAIAVVLGHKVSVRKSTRSYNSEVGVPLVILGCESGWLNIGIWIFNILKGLKLLFCRNKYPVWLVLELGVERPGDMSRLISWVKPSIVVVTALADIPPHVEFFAGPESLAKEKAKILRNLTTEDLAILNSDDDSVYDLKDKTKARIITYGFGEGADLIASNYRILFRDNGPEGITFKVDYRGNSIPVRLFNAFGKHHVYPALAGLAVGTALDFNLVDMSESLTGYQAPPGRLKLIRGVKNSFILDDTYNSSPLALRAALETLGDIPAKRKLAVLGDMLELGKYTIEAHRSMADYVFPFSDIVFTVGPRAKFIAEGLREKGFKQENIFMFSDSDEAKKEVEKTVEEGDLILVKGSQAMRMEKIVEEIMAEPEGKAELLVRQEKVWQDKP